MHIALFADIHSNREAFEACLAHARSQHVSRIVLLGDYVGYGADPEWVVTVVADLVAKGAIAVVGNHDRVISEPNASMNPTARVAIDWTREQLSTEAKTFLAQLPMTIEEGARLYVHADASAPARWIYVTDSNAARRSIEATHAQATFCGHVHRPAIYSVATNGKLTSFLPVAGVSIPLLRHRRWLAVLGSVGQPRDGNPAACYAILNTQSNEITFVRVPYDVESSAQRIRAVGLPDALAERLLKGY